ncbi:MAG: cyclodeaminase/cyclohydrolase family protein [Ruminococcaceae bacterium]|nr:cyclodeaminase/cyclohydrolase family protein [Oscillospiraceae bacterium]
MGLIHLTLKEFIAVTASDAPAPGGGSVSALAGALSAALAEMVANLTVGKEKYAASQDTMATLLPQVRALTDAFVLAVDADSRAFDGYMAALAMPKATDEEKAARSKAMQNGLKEAARVPLRVAELAVSLFPHLQAVLTLGNKNAVTDAMVGTMLARTCALGAIYNVRVNLSSIKDEVFVAELSSACERLQADAIALEQALLQKVPEISKL